MDSGFANLRGDMDSGFANLRGEFKAETAAMRADIIKWMFVFWVSSALIMVGLG